MSTNEKSEGESGEQALERTLLAVLMVMIPPGRKGNVPGAAGIGFPALIRAERDYLPIREGLIRLMHEAQNTHGTEFSSLSIAMQTSLIERLKAKDFRFFSTLSNQITKFYYQNAQVVAALGLESRPPFPLGHDVDDGDLTLLEPVYERGRIYRPVDDV